jgi:hypothetical protein
MILAHKTISDDELLENYALIPWEKLFAAQEQYRREIDDVLSAGCGKPWEEKRKTYIGLKKTKLIFELDAAKVPASTIASDLDIDVATVYRHLQTKHGKRKSGRKAKPRSMTKERTEPSPNVQTRHSDPSN